MNEQRPCLPPPPEIAEYMFGVGWVDPVRLDEGRRRAFDRALRDGPRAQLAGGWWWSAYPELDPEGQGAVDRPALARAIYTAWTGRVPGTSTYGETTPLGVPTGQAELWFWAADRDDQQLSSDVRSWAASDGRPSDAVGVGPNGEPGWFPIVVELDDADDSLTGLDALRRAVRAIHPSWAAFLPESGIAVPGLDPSIPSTGVLPNVWVNDAWTGQGRRHRLLEVLRGAHREGVDGGTLIVTDPAVLPDASFAEWCYDPAASWNRLVDAATVLAEAARASRPATA